jgi:Uma2 family endonuclease
MPHYVITEVIDVPEPEIDHLITEDDTPVDNLPSAKKQRLLVESLYNSGQIERPFVADANVGIFTSTRQPAIVPDVFVSFDVELADDWWAKKHRSYFIWEFGKPPDVVVEIVSNDEGEETGKKLRAYAYMHVDYYVIHDPQLIVQDKPLQVYELYAGEYLPRPDYLLPRVGLSLMLWEGTYEGKQDVWLRWCDLNGNLILTGAERIAQEQEQVEQERLRAEQERERAEQEHERAEQEHERAEQERLRAEQERERAEQERLRAERLAAQLRLLGIDPESI